MSKSAPLTLKIKWTVNKFIDKWSYEIKMDFSFDHFPEEKIENMVLTELGVYQFENKNIAQIQAKRTCKEMQAYFIDEVYNLIVRENSIK